MEMNNTEQNIQPAQSSPQSSLKNNVLNQRGFWLSIIGILLLVVIIGIGGYLFSTERTASLVQKKVAIPIQPKNTPQSKTVLVINASSSSNPISKITRTTIVYSYDPSTKQKKEVLKLSGDKTVNEARVSPDGLKLYYHATNLLGFTNKITTVDNNGVKKEHTLVNNNLWTLSSPGILLGGGKNDCYWSTGSMYLACMLIERENPSGAGTGRAKIVVLNYNTGDIQDVFTSDLIALPQRAIVSTYFGGWLGNDKILIIQAKDNNASVDIQPVDFYIFNTTSKQIESKFSYQYDPGFDLMISPNTNQIFFDSFSRINEDRFIKYDLTANKDTVLASSKDVLSVRNPTISEDVSSLIYVLNSTNIHLYDLTTGQEKTITTPFPIFFVDALLPGNKLYVVRKTPENSMLFNSETQTTDDLRGIFIGLGFF